MGRAPCCEKMGLNKGPWTPEEDQTLISYIGLNGHSNWRALPKLAGLSRCGKSCRLRWVNYLKPDIKRGNFTPEEEEAIIKLHELLGNRWSAIAARLPGRTDNEIKNIWHTHLKKRLISNHQTNQEKLKKNRVTKPKSDMVKQNIKSKPNKSAKENTYSPAGSPQQSVATTTTTTTTTTATTDISCAMETSSEQYIMEIDESFWSENLTVDDFKMVSTIDINVDDQSKEFGFDQDCVGGGDGEMDFWYDVLVRAGGLPELPEF